MDALYSDLVEEREAPLNERKGERFSFYRIVGFFLRNEQFDIGKELFKEKVTILWCFYSLVKVTSAVFQMFTL